MLRRHETAVRRRVEGRHAARTPAALLGRWLGTPAGAFFVETPLYLLPKLVNLQSKHRVLELGCGQGAALRFLTAHFAFEHRPLALDIARLPLREAAAAAGDAYALLQGSASRLPLTDESCDLVIAGHLFRHLSDEGLLRCISEAHRVLRPGGILAAWEFAPTSSARLNRWNRRVLDRLGGAGQMRAFGTLATFAQEAHFDVIERPPLRPFLFPPVPRTSILAAKS